MLDVAIFTPNIVPLCSTLKVRGPPPHRVPAAFAATSSREFNLPHVWGLRIQR